MNTNKNSLVKFLLDHGYPEESITIDLPINKNYRSDIAVIDPDTNEILAVFEAKQEKKKNAKFAMHQYKAYSDLLNTKSIPLYTASAKEGNIPFEIYRLKSDDSGELEKESTDRGELPDYKILKNSAIRKKIQSVEKKKKEAVDTFQTVCWSMAFIAYVIFLFDYFNINKIDSDSLALMGAVAALVIIPFAGKLKFLGIEFERLSKKEKQ